MRSKPALIFLVADAACQLRSGSLIAPVVVFTNPSRHSSWVPRPPFARNSLGWLERGY